MNRRTERVPERVEIIDLTQDGRGVAKTEGKTLFVDGALPGETVDALRVRRRKNYDEGRVVDLLVPAADREQPACPYFGTCGGCSLQHLGGKAQLATKQRTLIENLEQLGGVSPARILPPVSGPALGYRRRARLGVRYVRGKGRVLAGFRERFSSFVADIDRCVVLAPPADELVKPVSELIGRLTLRQRIPQVEVSVGDNRTAMVFRVLEDPTKDDMEAFREFRNEYDVDVYLQRGGLQTVAPLDGISTRLEYTLPEFGLTLRFLPTDFVQINAAVNRQMVSLAVELVDAGPEAHILDLFSGLGNFALPLARSGATVTAVEGDAAMVDRARENAADNGIENVEFHVADLFSACETQPWAAKRYDAVLLDPPRAGAREILPVVAGTGAVRIVYISCNPVTLARDLGILVKEFGFTLDGTGVMDMFPHTTHVESIAVLRRG